LIKYIKSVLWRAAKCLSYIEEVRCLKVKIGTENIWAPSCTRVWGTALQGGRSRVWFPVASLGFFSHLILPAALWPWGRLNL